MGSLLMLLAFAGTVPTQEPSLDFGSFDRRLTALEQRVADLEKARSLAAPAVPQSVHVPAPRLFTVPSGFHAHRTVDGRTIVHHDSNHGNAAAHASVAHPWVKSAVAGQTVFVSSDGQGVASSAQYFQSSSCPGGVCPPQSTYRFAPFGGRFRR